ncbi:metallophosphoesterase [Neobacillus bataviensis LMG 21833]|uniref:Metallophosphoesterase n=1 Tax=Neobacillus bataviensis LMG 21833 TaxID=1117379 RepID=K6DBL5_9BACI|nr:metallophosphoesterase [Neobacillus bataviensis]EKN65453.1 metallophosphoesterase [Neobacillus bataviensis LMG 21833]
MGFILGVLVIYNLLLFYVGWNGWKWLQTFTIYKRSIKYIYWILLLFFAYSFMLGRWLEEFQIITWVGAIWLGIFYFSILFFPLVNLLVFLSRFTRFSKKNVIKWSGFITGIAIGCLIAIGIYNAYSPVVRTYTINIPKQVEGKQTLNMVMASDMHFGVLSGAHHAKNLVKQINSLHPDLVLFPGDIIDDDVKPYLDKGIPQILNQIHAPVYASFGNHDRDESADLVKLFTDSGMNVLDDKTVRLENGINLIGRKDRGYQDVVRAKLADLMEQADGTKPVILLDHQPYDFAIAEKNGVDLMLSGHTHRGQIAPMNLITNKIYENDWGYLKLGQFQSIVSSGYGFWGTPIRIGSRSEIVQLKVTFKQNQ